MTSAGPEQLSEALVKSGAVISTAGVVMLVTFLVVLVVFPVAKSCDNGTSCSYSSTAPGVLAQIVQPGYLAVSLLLIAAGVLMVRFGRRRDSKKTESEGG